MADAPLDIEQILRDFPGEIPLFPLPNLVLLPDGLAPLHIFEERYRSMTADALDGDRLIGMALLRPGWETEYAGRPPIHEAICVGAILNHEKLEGGRYKILLYGVARARVLEETQAEPYRRARVEILPDALPASDEAAVAQRLHRVLERLPGRRGRIGKLRALAAQVRGGSGGPGRLADAAAEAADLEAPERYDLLAEPDVLRRLDLLLGHIDRRHRARHGESPARGEPRMN